MSAIIDALFGKPKPRFSVVKLKTNLQMCITRLTMQQSSVNSQVNIKRKEIATLLQSDRYELAMVKAEGMMRDLKRISAYELLQLFLSLLIERSTLLAEAKACPADLKEAASTAIWVTPHIPACNELLVVREQFAAKFGDAFVKIAQENSELAVNDRVIELLSITIPDPRQCYAVLKEIATAFNIEFHRPEPPAPPPPAPSGTSRPVPQDGVPASVLAQPPRVVQRVPSPPRVKPQPDLVPDVPSSGRGSGPNVPSSGRGSGPNVPSSGGGSGPSAASAPPRTSPPEQSSAGGPGKAPPTVLASAPPAPQDLPVPVFTALDDADLESPSCGRVPNLTPPDDCVPEPAVDHSPGGADYDEAKKPGDASM